MVAGKGRTLESAIKDATANLESVNNKIIERSENATWKNWSPAQYKMNIVELDKLKEERSKYQAQADEAKEMLANLAKEAKEAKADPQWIK